MKKSLLGITTILMLSLTACNPSNTDSMKNTFNGYPNENGVVKSSKEIDLNAEDWYTPKYFEYYEEPYFYGSFMEFNYKNEKERNELFEYLETVENGKYVSNFPVPLDSNVKQIDGYFYTSSYYTCCEEFFKRQSLNFSFEIDEPYYRYGMNTDWYGEDIFHLRVDYNFKDGVVLEKYYKTYTNIEVSKEEFENLKKNNDWHGTSHWTGNFVPNDEYKNYSKFEIVFDYYLCTRMFFSYDKDRALDKVRIYEKTPSSSPKLEIVGIE